MNGPDPSGEMKRREFLGAAAAAAALGGLEGTPASGQETKAGADTKGNAAQLYKRHAPNRRQHDRPLPDLSQYDGMKDQKDEGTLPSAYAEKEKKRIKELGLEPADSIEDKSEISCFQRGSTPHWSGINTFLKLPYLEDVRKVGEYDVAFVGVPFDIGCTFRTGTRFGPQGMRRISALYQKYSYEHGIDLGETLAMCDVGDIFCPANITKSHDQITKGVAHILSQGTLPMIMGGDHSIGYPIARGGRPVRGRQGGHHPRRSPRGHAGKGHGRDHAHLSVVPRHQHPELPADEPGAARDRRLAGAPRRREGGAGTRHDDPDRQRHREDRDRQDHRDRPGSRVEGGERRLPVVRHRLARRGLRPRDGLARAGRTPPPRGA